jgi:hypothetical protein
MKANLPLKLKRLFQKKIAEEFFEGREITLLDPVLTVFPDMNVISFETSEGLFEMEFEKMNFVPRLADGRLADGAWFSRCEVPEARDDIPAGTR